MATKVPIPKLGQSEETVKIEKWRVKEGDAVKKGEILFEVETDKAVLEVESQFEGTILKIVIPAGVPVPVMSIAAVIGNPGEEIPAIEAPAAPAPKAAAAPAAAKTPSSAAAPKSVAAPQTAALAAPVIAAAPAAKAKPSPRARKFAESYLINLDKVPGSGGGVGNLV